MSGLKVLYKGSQPVSSDISVVKTLLTSGKYCEDNIGLIYDNPIAPNLIPESVEASSTEIYNSGLGYKNGYYISVGNESANTNDCITGCIPYIINTVQPTDILYIRGYTGGASESHTRMCVRSADKTRITEFNGFLSSNNIFDVEVLDTGYYKLTPKTGIHHSYTNVAWLQFSFHQPDGSKIIITKNEELSPEDILERVNVPFAYGDIPDYVKTEAIAVAEKVRAVQTSKTITSIVWADAHHTKDQVTGWQAQTNISTLHAAMGMSIIAASCPIDFCAYCGDYTFGNGDTTFDLFEGQVKEMNRYMDVAFGGVPAMYCVGNHDTGEYLVREHSEESLFGAENVYRLIGSRNADGVTVMGSTRYGYCYRDIPSKKVRVINLNTVEGETETGYLGDKCSDTQLLWFAQTLYSIGNNSDWGIIVVSHYPLDYGGTCHAGNIVYQYVNGGSVTYNGTTVNFSGHNSAKFIAQYHGHTHCLKAAKLNYVSNSQGTEFDAYRIATPSGTFYRNNDYKDVVIYGINFGETETYPKTADSGKDTAFVVNVYDPDKEIVFSFCYGAGYDRSVSIGKAKVYSVTNNLTHVASSNNSASAVEGDSYSATISATTPWSVGTITVTMGGTDITSTAVSGSTISIAEVTGNIVIMASGVTGNLINYFGYTDGKRLSTSTAGYKDKTGGTVIEFIDLSEFVENETVTLHITGARFAHNSSSSDWDDNVYIFYKSDKSSGSSGGYTIGTNTRDNITLSVTHTNYTDTVITITGLTQKLVTDSYKYIRLCGVGSGANVDIRVNE